jgi:hypothetical protein
LIITTLPGERWDHFFCPFCRPTPGSMLPCSLLLVNTDFQDRVAQQQCDKRAPLSCSPSPLGELRASVGSTLVSLSAWWDVSLVPKREPAMHPHHLGPCRLFLPFAFCPC